MLKHPLVFGVPYHEEMNNHYNKSYEVKKQAAADALTTGKLFRFVFLHERPYRLDAFLECTEKATVPDEDYWELLGEMWTDSENIWQNLSTWKRLMRSKRNHRHLFMDEEEREVLKALPKQLTVYRGCTRNQNEHGLSWTLDKVKAKWFSERYVRAHERPCILEKTIPKSKVFAYLIGRGENEVIIL
jgi:hypothetical protein